MKYESHLILTPAEVRRLSSIIDSILSYESLDKCSPDDIDFLTDFATELAQ